MSERLTINLDNLDDINGFPPLSIYRSLLQSIQGRCAVANGCFDVLHPGHLSLLAQLDTLAYQRRLRPIVAINSDASVKRLKGNSRPFVPQESRAALLNNLKWPFTVIIFEEDTPQRLMDLLRPPLVVKGSEYDPTKVVKWSGSEVVTMPMIDGWSTTKMLGDTR